MSLIGGLLQHDRAIALRDARCCQIRVPVESGRVRLQLGDAHRVVDLVDIAPIGRRPADFRDLGFERQHRVGVLRRLRIARHREGPLDVGAIRVELRLERGGQVVVAIGQPEPGLAEEERVQSRVRRIGPTPGPNNVMPNVPFVSPMNVVNASLSAIAATRSRSACSGLSSSASTVASFMKLRYMPRAGWWAAPAR